MNSRRFNDLDGHPSPRSQEIVQYNQLGRSVTPQCVVGRPGPGAVFRDCLARPGGWGAFVERRVDVG